jgi:23S rRNA (adenine2503-C2)-methyltransferase
MPDILPNIKSFTKEELGSVVSGFGEPGFRSGQIHRWLYSGQADGFEEMTNLSASLRKKLADSYTISSASLARSDAEETGGLTAEEGPTIKYLLQMPDGEHIESVLIPSQDRLTVCVSSQAGCPLRCSFCATGHMGFKRSLKAFEITDQVYLLQQEAEKTVNRSITNVVFMGMGEPLLNLNQVIEAVGTLSDSAYRINIPPKKITISTVGLIPGILRLGKSGLRTKLAVSLHSADQQTRERLIPMAKQYTIRELRQSLIEYTRDAGEPVTLVYMLLEGINDSPEEARKLAAFARSFLCKINLIDYNSIVNINFKPVYSEQKNTFVRHLLDSGLHVTLRKSHGSTINAACGQLANSDGTGCPGPQ